MANYYIDLNTGNDSAPGDGSTANPWRTIQKFLDITPSAGDNCYVRGNATGADAISASLILKSSGTSTSPISIIGCTGSGTTWTEGTLGTVQINKTGAVNQLLYDNNVSRTFWIVKNFQFSSADANNIYFQAGGANNSRIENCIINNATTNGVSGVNATTIINCSIYSNGAYGIVSTGSHYLSQCRIYSNTTGGISNATNGSAIIIEDSIFYNQGYGLRMTGTGGRPQINRCIFDTHATRAISIESYQTAFIFQYIKNSIFSNNGTGIFFNTAAYSPANFHSANNAFYNNSADASGYVLTSNITLTADPYVNSTGGADFSLNTTAGGGAACRRAGFPSSIAGATATNLEAPSIGIQANSLDLFSDPGVANVVSPTAYQFNSTTNNRTGTYGSTSPVITNVATSSASITTAQSTTITCDVTNTPDNVVCTIGDIAFDMDFVSGVQWSATISGYQIGIVTGVTITCQAIKAGQPSSPTNSAQTQTVTAAANKTTALITEVQASMTGAGLTTTTTLTTEKTLSTTIYSLLLIRAASYSTTTIDQIRTTAFSAYTGWTSTSAIQEKAAPYLTTTDFYLLVTHT